MNPKDRIGQTGRLATVDGFIIDVKVVGYQHNPNLEYHVHIFEVTHTTADPEFSTRKWITAGRVYFTDQKEGSES